MEQQVQYTEMAAICGAVKSCQAVLTAAVYVCAFRDEQTYQLEHDFFLIAGIGHVGRCCRAAKRPDLKKCVASSGVRIRAVIEKKKRGRDLAPITGAVKRRAACRVERLDDFWIGFEHTKDQIKRKTSRGTP